MSDPALGQIRDVAIRHAAGLVGMATEDDLSGLERHEPGERFEKSRLARAVRSEQADAAAATQFEGDVVQRGNAVVGDRQVADEKTVIG